MHDREIHGVGFGDDVVLIFQDGVTLFKKCYGLLCGCGVGYPRFEFDFEHKKFVDCCWDANIFEGLCKCEGISSVES